MRIRPSKSLAVLTVLFVLGVPAEPVHGQLYKATDLGTIGGDSAEAYAINDYGQVVGRSTDEAGESHIFHWSNGQMNALLYENTWGRRVLPSAVYSVGYGCSNTDIVVGTFLEPLEDDPSLLIQRGMIFSPVTATDATTPLPAEAFEIFDTSSAATGISRNGLYVVGWADTADSQVRGVVLSPVNGTWSVVASLSALEAPDENSSATAVNNDGQIVGWVYTAPQGYSAFLITPLEDDDDTNPWLEDGDGDGHNDLMLELGTLGGDNSWARDINDNGWIVGESDTSDWHTHAFLWANGEMTDLGTLGGNDSSAAAINNDGVVVGTSIDNQGRSRAFALTPNDTDGDGTPDQWYLDEDGDGANDLMADLNDHLQSGFAMRLTHARDINESGEIVGWGETGGSGDVLHMAYLLQPAGEGAGASGTAGDRDDATLEPIEGTPNLIQEGGDDGTGIEGEVSGGDGETDGTTAGTVTLGPLHWLCGVGFIDMLPFMLAGLIGLQTTTRRMKL